MILLKEGLLFKEGVCYAYHYSFPHWRGRGKAVGTKITQKQIRKVKRLECALINPKNEDRLTWDDFDNKDALGDEPEEA